MADVSSLVGLSLKDVPVPSAVLDRAVVARNCRQMLTICDKVGVEFRAHIKTHKTAELTALQVGPAPRPVNLIVSTTLEAFHIQPFLEACQREGRPVNVLYGVPLAPSRIADLRRLSDALGPASVTVMIDHPAQLDALAEAPLQQQLRPRCFVKVDTGYGRAGVPDDTGSVSLRQLCARMRDAQERGHAAFHGFYSHGGDSYGVGAASEAFDILARELRGLQQVARVARLEGLRSDVGGGYVLSVGATPTISAAWMSADEQAMHGPVPELIRSMQASGDVVEFHAGNYPVLDMQQLATVAGVSSKVEMPSAHNAPHRTPSDIAMTILAEVNSKYSERDVEEALVTTGTLAMGREPCKSYGGWGVVSAWPRKGGMSHGSGWYLHAVSQEHGKIRKGEVPGVPVVEDSEKVEYHVGDRVRLWPNHACVACSNYSAFLVVDSGDEAGGQVVREVWKRCIGW